MAAFCDECASSFPRPTSKFCSECGTPRVGNQIAETTTVVDVVRSTHEDVVDVVRSTEVVNTGEEPDLPLYAIPQMPALTLYARVYEARPKGLPKDIAWGKRFLKQHRRYKRQYVKVKRNQRIVREWFKPGTNEFVDEFLKSSSLRWDPTFLKRVRKYCKHTRKKADDDEDEENMVCDIKFPDEGLILHWKTSDIVKHVFEIKHYRKGKKCSATILQLREVEENIEVGEQVIGEEEMEEEGGDEMEANGREAHEQVEVANASNRGSRARRPPKRFRE